MVDRRGSLRGMNRNPPTAHPNGPPGQMEGVRTKIARSNSSSAWLSAGHRHHRRPGRGVRRGSPPAGVLAHPRDRVRNLHRPAQGAIVTTPIRVAARSSDPGRHVGRWRLSDDLWDSCAAAGVVAAVDRGQGGIGDRGRPAAAESCPPVASPSSVHAGPLVPGCESSPAGGGTGDDAGSAADGWCDHRQRLLWRAAPGSAGRVAIRGLTGKQRRHRHRLSAKALAFRSWVRVYRKSVEG